MKTLLRIIILALLFIVNTIQAEAPEVDNNAGTWIDNFGDQLGTFDLQNVVIDVFGGTTQLGSGQNNGSQTSVIISPPMMRPTAAKIATSSVNKRPLDSTNSLTRLNDTRI